MEKFLLTYSSPCQFLCNVLNMLFRSPVKTDVDLQINNVRANGHLARPVCCKALFIALEFCGVTGFSMKYLLSGLFSIFFLEDQCIVLLEVLWWSFCFLSVWVLTSFANCFESIIDVRPFFLCVCVGFVCVFGVVCVFFFFLIKAAF